MVRPCSPASSLIWLAPIGPAPFPQPRPSRRVQPLHFLFPRVLPSQGPGGRHFRSRCFPFRAVAVAAVSVSRRRSFPFPFSRSRSPVPVPVAMGAHLARRYFGGADTEPDPLQTPTFPPELGLPQRRPRTMVAPPEVLAAARIPLQQRDFCAHLLVLLQRCQRGAFPEPWSCSDLKHRGERCEHEDYVMRMKEFERERRLLQRQKRRRLREEAAAAAEHA
uniref:NADH dehydrogenase [ubiquinone] 1 beta subcomplex subunit 7 n=1 Tax=Amazona collaria TaxID=241587 RepID=A0A8B9IWI6_9PSIT